MNKAEPIATALGSAFNMYLFTILLTMVTASELHTTGMCLRSFRQSWGIPLDVLWKIQPEAAADKRISIPLVYDKSRYISYLTHRNRNCLMSDALSSRRVPGKELRCGSLKASEYCQMTPAVSHH